MKMFFLTGPDYFSVRKYFLFYLDIFPHQNNIIFINSLFFLYGTNLSHTAKIYSFSAHIFSILTDIFPYKHLGKVKRAAR